MSARMLVSVSEGAQGAVLKFLEGSGLEGEISLNLEQLSQLISSLGQVRRTLVETQTVPPLAGATFQPVMRTNWVIQPEALTEGALFAFQHPAYGPVGLVLKPDDSAQVIKALQRNRAMLHSSQPLGKDHKPS